MPDLKDVRIVLRDSYSAAGGVHDDWDEYDRVMAEDKRIAILINPERVLRNAPAI